MLASVIIPTYNRKETIQRTLSCLENQDLPHGSFEVILVDDGSDNSNLVLEPFDFPFLCRCLHQENRGATQARNNGAMNSVGNILVFLDDDICISRSGLQSLIRHAQEEHKAIILGSLVLPEAILEQSIFARIDYSPIELMPIDAPVHFTRCMTGLLAIPRQDFFDLEMFQDPAGGWPNWDDVDFGYRAMRQGYHFIRCSHAIAEHWDSSVLSLKMAYNRAWRASHSAARLFQVHPGLINEIPMFRDSQPIDREKDSPQVRLRKMSRPISSSMGVLWLLQNLAALLEKLFPSPDLLHPVYRWVIGGYVYRGYKAGLSELSVNRGTG